MNFCIDNFFSNFIFNLYFFLGCAILWHVGSSSPDKKSNLHPALKVQSLNY